MFLLVVRIDNTRSHAMAVCATRLASLQLLSLIRSSNCIMAAQMFLSVPLAALNSSSQQQMPRAFPSESPTIEPDLPIFELPHQEAEQPMSFQFHLDSSTLLWQSSNET
jgi:hypothetical protein